jgi:hypothetical protein
MDHLLDGSWCYWNHDGEPTQPSATAHSQGGMDLPQGLKRGFMQQQQQQQQQQDGASSSSSMDMVNGSSSSSSSGSRMGRPFPGPHTVDEDSDVEEAPLSAGASSSPQQQLQGAEGHAAS